MTTPRFKEGQRLQLGTHDFQIRRLQRWLLLTTMLAALGTASGAYGTWSAGKAAGKAAAVAEDTRALAETNRQLALRVAHDARVTTAALCAQRRGVEVQVKSSLEFLRDHPNGFLGVSAKAIRDSIANQQRTIDNLSVIDCPK